MDTVHSASGRPSPAQDLSCRDSFSSPSEDYAVTDSPTLSHITENAHFIMPDSSKGTSLPKALLDETVASCQDETQFSQEKSSTNRGSDRDLARMWSGRLQGRSFFESPPGKRNDPDEYQDSLAGIESQALGKGKGKAADFLQNHSLKALTFEEETDTDMFHGYLLDQDDDSETFPSDFYDPIGEEPSDRSFLLADYFLKSFNQFFAKPSSEHPKFVAGPSRITLDDLKRDCMFQSRHWP